MIQLSVGRTLSSLTVHKSPRVHSSCDQRIVRRNSKHPRRKLFEALPGCGTAKNWRHSSREIPGGSRREDLFLACPITLISHRPGNIHSTKWILINICSQPTSLSSPSSCFDSPLIPSYRYHGYQRRFSPEACSSSCLHCRRRSDTRGQLFGVSHNLMKGVTASTDRCIAPFLP